MDAKDYTVRCDKCQFKPYVYCEMCMVRTKLQNAIEVNDKALSGTLAQTHLAIQVLNDCFNKLENQIDFIKGFLNI